MENYRVYCSLLVCVLAIFTMSQASVIAPSASASHNIFAADIFNLIATENTEKNVIFSPASIQTCLALAYLGAEGDTATAMRQGLKLPLAGDKNEIAKDYGEFLKKSFSTKSDGPTLKMANAIYVKEDLQLSPAFNDLATKYFASKVESIRFDSSAVNKINSWVEENTENKIKDLLQEGIFDGGETSSVLLNAIYFKGKWARPFSKSSTQKDQFKISPSQTVDVDMMYSDDRFRYAESTKLNAKVLEMPYEKSNLSMMIILPNKENGLQELEKQLATVDLNEISSETAEHSVDVFIPKFKIDFDIDLKKTLEKMGMSIIFSDKANFGSLFINADRQKVSDVMHKAYIDVNEAGSEAAAATFMRIVPMSLNMDQKVFRADRPFVFAIRDSRAVYFAGHVVKF